MSRLESNAGADQNHARQDARDPGIAQRARDVVATERLPCDESHALPRVDIDGGENANRPHLADRDCYSRT